MWIVFDLGAEEGGWRLGLDSGSGSGFGFRVWALEYGVWVLFAFDGWVRVGGFLDWIWGLGAGGKGRKESSSIPWRVGYLQ